MKKGELHLRVGINCVYCYLRQAASCMEVMGITDRERQHEILYEIMDYIKTFNTRLTPAENTSLVYHKLYEMTGHKDPYRKLKKQSNNLALELYPRLRKMLDASNNPLYDALKIAAAGNIIDLGIHPDYDIEKALDHSMTKGFARDDFLAFTQKLGSADEVMIIGDNSGEIVFDKLLAEELVRMGKKAVYVVKESFVSNDATMEDAVYTGLDKVAKVISNGSNYLGSCMGRVSKEFITALAKAPLIISKGHANFESLENEPLVKDKAFYLLKIKCNEVAKAAGAKLDDVVFMTTSCTGSLILLQGPAKQPM
jgi:uncharacterized protein with ATP-grasp and redox domains